jgi:hypothetical protein
MVATLSSRRVDAPAAGREIPTERWAQALVVTVWAWAVLPRIIQSLSAPKVLTAVGEAGPPLNPLAEQLGLALTFGIVGLCFLIVLDRLTTLPATGLGSVALLLAPWAYLVGRDQFLDVPLAPATLIWPAVVVAVWVLQPRIEWLALLGQLVGATAIVSLALAIAKPSSAILLQEPGRLLTEEKSVLPWGILVGVFTHGNNLGQFMVLGLPLVFLVPQRGRRRVFVAVTLLCILWSASRSSFFAVGIVVVAALVIRLAKPAARPVVGAIVCIAAFTFVSIVPFVTSDPAAFTNRGLIWALSEDWWRTNTSFGLGSRWYEVVALSSSRVAGSVFHGHKQFVHLLVTGGMLLAALVAVMLLATIGRAGRLAARGQPFGIVYLVALAGTCMLEITLGFVDNFGLMALVVLPLSFILLGQMPGDDRPASAGGEEQERTPVTRGGGPLAADAHIL